MQVHASQISEVEIVKVSRSIKAFFSANAIWKTASISKFNKSSVYDLKEQGYVSCSVVILAWIIRGGHVRLGDD